MNDEELRKYVKEELDADKIYPKDIFLEISKEELEKINSFLLREMKFPLDRLSAYISRKVLEGLKEKLGGAK
jgi:hypothetical protein